MSTSKIVFGYTDANGGKRNISYNYADPEATTSDVKALAQALVTNGSIFANPPTVVNTAKIVTTSESEYDLSE